MHISLQLVKMFGSVIRMYSSNFHLFPHRFLDKTIGASSSIMKGLESEMENLVEYRSLFELKFGVKPTMENIQNYARLTFDICNEISDSIEYINNDSDTSIKHRKAILSLKTRCEEIVLSLHDVNSLNNYVMPSSLECLGRSDKVSWTQMRGQNRKNDEDPVSSKSRMDLVKGSKRQKIDESPSVVGVLKIEAFHGGNDLSETDDNDSFGVIGDWGEDS